VRKPLLLVVAGPPGSGKTTLSRVLGDELGLPVLCRDGIKEGVVFTTGELVSRRTLASGGPNAATYHVDLAGVPTLDVDTTSGYEPELESIVAFAGVP
jgi:hypothetical protein